MAIRKQIDTVSKPNWKIYDIYDNPEWKLAESMAMEFTDIAGIEAVYYRQDPTVTPDVLYGETQNKEYVVGKSTNVIYEVGEIPTSYSMFGMITTDQIVVHVPQATYRRDVSQTEPPRVGDVIHLPFYQGDKTYLDNPEMSKPGGRTFEIIHVAEDQNIFQFKSLVYSLYMIPYRFSEESETAKDVSSDLPTTTPSITAFGDNDWIEEQSDNIDTYEDVDRSIYGK